MIQKTFLNDLELSYPRLCAHRGFNAIAPENSMPAFGAAYALGADEIEFDIWETIDGVLVSCHDASLERVSNGKGFIYEMMNFALLISAQTFIMILPDSVSFALKRFLKNLREES